MWYLVIIAIWTVFGIVSWNSYKQHVRDRQRIEQMKFWRDQVVMAQADTMEAIVKGNHEEAEKADQRFHLAYRRFHQEMNR